MMDGSQFGSIPRRQALLAILAFFLMLAGLTLYQNLFAPALADMGDFLLKWGIYGVLDEQFNYPNGVAVDGAGNVYVADTYNHRIQKFDNNGEFLRAWGEPGTGEGEFDTPYGVAVDGVGNVYVADTDNHRIQKFDRDGVFQLEWGSEGTGNGTFKFPYGVAVDQAGNVYVVDVLNYRVQKFDGEGQFLATWGKHGDQDGEFLAPRGIVADGIGSFYATDTNLARVQKFNSDGTFSFKWGEWGSEDGEFKNPFGVTLDGDGYVYVADVLNDRIQVFESNGVFESKWGTPGDRDKQFTHPYDVAVDGAGNVFVADTDNHRIQKFGGAAPTMGLNVTKEATPDAGVAYHGQVTYTIVLSNGGVADAWAVLLTDTLPGQVDFYDWVVKPPGADMDQNDKLTWAGTVTAGKAITFTYIVTHVGDYKDRVVNTVEYTHFSKSGSSQATFDVVGPPLLSIAKSASPVTGVVHHGLVTYTVVLSNTGQTDAAGTLLTDTLPDQVDFVHWVSQPPGASVDASDELTWNGMVTAGQAITFAFVVGHVGDYGDLVTNRAEYAHSTSSGVADATFSVADRSILSAEESVTPDTGVARHHLVTYSIILRNGGGLDVPDVQLTDTLPSEVGFVRWIKRPPGAFMDANNQLTWSGAVKAGQAIAFTFVAIYLEDGGDEVTNTAEYVSSMGKGSVDATFWTVGFSPLSITKAAMPETRVSTGDPVTYTVLLSNTSVRDLFDVTLTDELPGEVDFYRWAEQPPGARLDDGTVTWTGPVSSGETVDLAFVVTYARSQGRVVTNTAEFAHASGAGSDDAIFQTGSYVYLPMVLRGVVP